MDAARVLSGLIAIDTSIPPGENYGAAMDYLEPYFKQVGFETNKIEIPAEHAEGRTGRINLIAHRRNPGKPRLIFYGHADVVPAAGWDAFKATVKDGKLYGRGAADMKGGIVGLLVGLEAVKTKPVNYDISVAITTDEEFSQASQLRYIARFLEPVKGTPVFCLDSNFGFVAVTGLGALHMVVRVKGKSVHSGLSHLGENAIEKSVPMLQALLELKKKVAGRKSRIPVTKDTGLDFMVPRLNINVIQGGLKVNIVPDFCDISIDRRTIPEESIADAEKELMDCLKSVPGVNWEVEGVTKIPAVPPREDPIIDKLAQTIKEVTGNTGKFGEMGSGDLSTIVADDWKGHEFGLGVIRPDNNIHGKDEFVYLKDIEDLGKIVAKFLTE